MTRLDRRALFTSGAAAALLAATGASVHATPKSGGVLRLAVPRDGDVMGQVARWAVYDALTEIGPDGVVRGELAESWTSSMDARVWTFQLRKDVMFHSGRSLTSADVEASLLRAPLSEGEVLGIWCDDTHVLRLELDRPNPHLPYLLADQTHVITADGVAVDPLDQADGTGLYRVVRAKEARHFRAERQLTHYKDGHAGWFEAVEIIVIPDENTRAEALRDGFVDVAALPKPDPLRSQRSVFFYPSSHDVAFAADEAVGLPRQIGTGAILDDGRLAERWWMGEHRPSS
ncbi:ABC transporter substrate-binding protein [Epibacterium ulvae]|uniref:ABC transporter substrate-binding protein n=1 Tax=Epibacterium ulvae TaxID=1156985 RepID=UPI002492CE39|nr:ABC transporter substrate-binding protein [Epibacterium ulvae]